MAESLPIPFREQNAPPNTPPLLLFFEEIAIKDEKASMDGPPVFDRSVQVRVVVAGTRGDGPIYEMQRTRSDGTVKQGDGYYRFREPFDIWMKGQTPSESGTPLEQWPLMDVATVASLKAANVYTVQQLATLSDQQAENSLRRGGTEWRAKAKSWLEGARTAAEEAKSAAREAKMQDEIAELREQVKMLLQKQNNVGFDPPKRGKKKGGDDIQIIDTPTTEDARL
jgi:hypothetical protein